MKSRTLVTWIAVSLVIHVTILILPRVFEFTSPTTKKTVEVGIIYVPVSALISPKSSDRASSITSKRSPQPKNRFAPPSHSTPESQLSEGKSATPVVSGAIKPTMNSNAKPHKTGDLEATHHASLSFLKSPQKNLTATLPNQFTNLANNQTFEKDKIQEKTPDKTGTQVTLTSSSPTLFPLAADTTTTAAKLSEKVVYPPRYDINPPPNYPAVALKKRWQGEVRLHALVGKQGEVINVWVENSSGHAVLDNTALNTVRRWKFHPAHDGDKNIQEEILLPIRFELPRS